jgi:hypothetical protein
VSTRPAALTAVTRVLKLPASTAVSTMSFWGAPTKMDVIVTSEIMDVITFFMCFNLGQNLERLIYDST